MCPSSAGGLAISNRLGGSLPAMSGGPANPTVITGGDASLEGGADFVFAAAGFAFAPGCLTLDGFTPGSFGDVAFGGCFAALGGLPKLPALLAGLGLAGGGFELGGFPIVALAAFTMGGPEGLPIVALPCFAGGGLGTCLTLGALPMVAAAALTLGALPILLVAVAFGAGDAIRCRGEGSSGTGGESACALGFAAALIDMRPREADAMAATAAAAAAAPGDCSNKSSASSAIAAPSTCSALKVFFSSMRSSSSSVWMSLYCSSNSSFRLDSVTIRLSCSAASVTLLSSSPSSSSILACNLAT
mmetsp:Transcript_32061/g.75208  ORF Transcript_32061/g.75208 Transcript_32061/m.75208 type:complete len:302 (-) Transcript_32061:1029-1934(-)